MLLRIDTWRAQHLFTHHVPGFQKKAKDLCALFVSVSLVASACNPKHAALRTGDGDAWCDETLHPQGCDGLDELGGRGTVLYFASPEQLECSLAQEMKAWGDRMTPPS